MAAAITAVGTRYAFAYQTYNLSSNRVIAVGSTETLVSHTQVFVQGETHTIQGVLAVTSDSSGNMLVGVRVKCGTDYGLWTTQNNTGKPEVTTVTVNWIWTAPSAGSFTCSMVAITGAGKGSTSTNTITAQAGGKTYMLISDNNWTGSTNWSTATDCSLDPPACDAGDNGVFVGSGTGGGSTEYVLHSGTWTAASTTRQVLVQMDAELTACMYGTNSCPSSDWGPSSLGNSGSAGSYYPVVTITSTSGASCSVYTGSSKSFSISYDEHHKKFFTQTILSIAVGSSCRRFSAKLYLAVSSSLNPLRVEPEHYSIGYFINYQ